MTTPADRAYAADRARKRALMEAIAQGGTDGRKQLEAQWAAEADAKKSVLAGELVRSARAARQPVDAARAAPAPAPHAAPQAAFPSAGNDLERALMESRRRGAPAELEGQLRQTMQAPTDRANAYQADTASSYAAARSHREAAGAEYDRLVEQARPLVMARAEQERQRRLADKAQEKALTDAELERRLIGAARLQREEEMRRHASEAAANDQRIAAPTPDGSDPSAQAAALEEEAARLRPPGTAASHRAFEERDKLREQASAAPPSASRSPHVAAQKQQARAAEIARYDSLLQSQSTQDLERRAAQLRAEAQRGVPIRGSSSPALARSFEERDAAIERAVTAGAEPVEVRARRLGIDAGLDPSRVYGLIDDPELEEESEATTRKPRLLPAQQAGSLVGFSAEKVERERDTPRTYITTDKDGNEVRKEGRPFQDAVTTMSAALADGYSYEDALAEVQIGLQKRYGQPMRDTVELVAAMFSEYADADVHGKVPE